MTRGLRVALCIMLMALLFLAVQTGAGRSKTNLKKYLSPDSSLVASVLTVTQDDNGDSESKVEFRTSKGKLIGGKSFMSKDHAHGLGVMKAGWTFDSKFFVFSTIASGGAMQRNFPTIFFSRKDNQLHMLNGSMKAKIISPEFDLEYPDGVSVLTERIAKDGQTTITESYTMRLSQVRDK